MKYKTLFAMMCMLFVVCFSSAQSYFTPDDSAIENAFVDASQDLSFTIDLPNVDYVTTEYPSNFLYVTSIVTTEMANDFSTTRDVDLAKDVDLESSLILPMYIDVDEDCTVTFGDGDVIRTILENQSITEPKRILCSTDYKELGMEVYLYSDMTYGVVRKPPEVFNKNTIK